MPEYLTHVRLEFVKQHRIVYFAYLLHLCRIREPSRKFFKYHADQPLLCLIYPGKLPLYRARDVGYVCLGGIVKKTEHHHSVSKSARLRLCRAVYAVVGYRIKSAVVTVRTAEH